MFDPAPLSVALPLGIGSGVFVIGLFEVRIPKGQKRGGKFFPVLVMGISLVAALVALTAAGGVYMNVVLVLLTFVLYGAFREAYSAWCEYDIRKREPR